MTEQTPRKSSFMYGLIVAACLLTAGATILLNLQL